jgi:hypothetical protein
MINSTERRMLNAFEAVNIFCAGDRQHYRFYRRCRGDCIRFV